MAKVSRQSLPSSQQSDISNDFVEGRLLDGFLLLAAGGATSPDEVVSVNLSSLQLVDVAAEDLAFFVHLDRLDASDNQLGYESIVQQMGRLPRLSTLTLACNSIASLQVKMGTLRQLQSLDLSFNELHGDVLVQLAHLPSLLTLNLSRNCISSVPPEEELYGLQALEELSLDSNDLVQFVQWRALDALPRLRKLSLASNRVKRLKDDAPDVAAGSGELSYFPQLEELNLSGNEIMGVECLPVVSVFKSLKSLILNDNPCTKGQVKEDQKIPNMSVICQETKPFYLLGSGCHQVREKKTDPRLKLPRQGMRKVRSFPQGGGRASRNRGGYGGSAVPQLGVLDEEANQLLFSLAGGGESHIAYNFGGVEPGGDEEDDVGGSFLTQPGAAPPPRGVSGHVAAPSVPGIFSDELSEEDLDRIFRERRANIDRKFNAEVEEPGSFMTPIPFPINAEAGKKLGLTAPPPDEEEEDTVAAVGGQGNVAGRRPSSSNFEDANEHASASSGAAVTRESRPGGSRINLVVGGGVAAIGQAPLQPGGQSAAAALFAEQLALGSPGGDGTQLPPLAPVSRASSAQRERSVTMGGDMTLPPLSHAGDGKARLTADVSVRDAMRALRAAATSEFAVAVK